MSGAPAWFASCGEAPSGLPAVSPTRGEKTHGTRSAQLSLRACGWVKPSPLWGGWGESFSMKLPTRTRGGDARQGRGGLIALVLAILFAILTPIPAFAVNPDEVLSDPALEQRARQISLNLRCMVCQNQSIDDSNAELAKDLRVLVRERLTNGDTDDEVIDYVVSRYGEFVLLNPRLSARTVILWTMPIGLLIAGIVALLVFVRSRPSQRAVAPLTDEEKARIEELSKG
jgi:cytochrome c-type biogenesis protein CcmH